MKKNYINLRHPERMDKRQPLSPSIVKPKPKPVFSNFTELSQQSIQCISSYLRLKEIICLYNCVRQSHRCEQIKRSIQNYLICTSRVFTQWEQKQFLGLLLVEVENKKQIEMINQNMQSVKLNKINDINQQMKTDNSNHNSIRKSLPIDQQYNQNIILTPFTYNTDHVNQKSRLNRFKQSIVYDVSRTFIKKCDKINKNGKLLIQNCHSKGNRNRDEDIDDQEIKIVNLNKNKDKNKNIQQRFQINNYCCSSGQHKLTNLNKLSQKQQPIPQVVPNNFTVNSNKTLSSCQQQFPQFLTQKKGSQSRLSEQSLQQYMQNYLKNVLINISQKYPQLGYIQGFNYIVKSMYMTGFTQQQSYNYLSYFIQTKYLGNIISNSMLGVRQLSYVLKVYIFNYIPKVYKHLIHCQLQPQIFCTSWFVTLFSEDLSYHVVNKLWHVFVLEGWKVFIKFGIALICAYQQEILERDSDDIFVYMRRIMEEFNQEIKLHSIAKQKRELEKEKSKKNWHYKECSNNLGKQQTWKKQQIVWKLMSSIQVNGAILSQLCREMNNLQKDSQIQIWRLQSSCSFKNLKSSRIHRTSSQRQHFLSHFHSKNIYTNIKNNNKNLSPYNSSEKLLSSSMGSCGSFQSKFGEQFCCDRTNFTDSGSGSQYELQKQKNHNKNNNKNNNNNNNNDSNNSNNIKSNNDANAGGGYLFTLCHNVGPYID